MASNVRLNHPGIAGLLQSAAVRRAVESKAADIARNVEAQGIRVGDRDGGPREEDLPVKVESYTTDRAAAAVVLAHPAGVAVQAKHGALTKAASQAGLEVKGGDK